MDYTVFSCNGNTEMDYTVFSCNGNTEDYTVFSCNGNTEDYTFSTAMVIELDCIFQLQQ